jgi:hypothetical protein
MNIENETIKSLVAIDSPLKQMLVDYVGKRYVKEEEKFDVTVEMIAETLATEFPEFMLVIAEENWIRGYKQGLDDAEKLYSKQTTE